MLWFYQFIVVERNIFTHWTLICPTTRAWVTLVFARQRIRCMPSRRIPTDFPDAYQVVLHPRFCLSSLPDSPALPRDPAHRNPLRRPSQNRSHRSHGPLTHTHALAVPAELLGSAFPFYSHLCDSLGKFVSQIQGPLRTRYQERTHKV